MREVWVKVTIITVVIVAFGLFQYYQNLPVVNARQNASNIETTQATTPAAAMTLENYFQGNPQEWNETVADIQAVDESLVNTEISVSSNKVNQIMTLKETYPPEMAQELTASFLAEEAAMLNSLSDSITQLEMATGIEGITWHYEYRNGDGTLLCSADVNA